VGEVDAGSGEEAGRCSAPLVHGHLHVGRPGAVVHGHVQVFVAGAPTFGGRAAPEHLVTPAVRDAGQLLGVQVQELPGTFLLIADHLPGGPVQIGKPGEAVPAQHTVDGRAGEPEARGEHVWAETELPAHTEDLLDAPAGERTWGTAGSGGAILKPGLPLLPETVQPLVDRGSGNTHGFRRLRRGPAVLRHPLHHQQSSLRGQLCPRMGHESLLFSVGAWQPQSEQGGSPFVNNVRGHYR